MSLDYEKKLARECVHAALKSEVRATTKGGLAMSPTVHSSCVLVLSTRAPKKWNSQAINEYIQVLLSHSRHWEASGLRKADVGIRAERPGGDVGRGRRRDADDAGHAQGTAVMRHANSKTLCII